MGEIQTVIKPLGRMFSQVNGIAGSTKHKAGNWCSNGNLFSTPFCIDKEHIMEKPKQLKSANKPSPPAQPRQSEWKAPSSVDEVRRQLGWGLIAAVRSMH